jgi:tRNA dimethylallyltransferase
MNKLLIVCGPTATGKTVLAATLAKKFNGELISADSRQVYRGMDLVTGKDRPASLASLKLGRSGPAGGPDFPIWLYDVANPDEEFSVSQWVKLAKQAIDDIKGRNKLPIVVGGTGLYIHALIKPFETIDIPRIKSCGRNYIHYLFVNFR